MIKLIFSQPEFGRQFVELPDGTFSVGRSSRGHIIVEEGSVSQRHADLQIHGTEVIVRERGSLNGTFIDGVRINPSSSVRGRVIGNLRRLPVREQEARVAFQRVVDHGSGGSHVVENCPLSRFRAMA